jgi:LCP family protein required for cell wall assembly
MRTYAEPVARRRPSGRPARPRYDRRPPEPKRKDPIWAKLCLILGALVMVLSGTAVVLPRVLANWAASDIPQENLLDGVGGDNISGAINLLLLGMDERAGNSTEPIRTDTMIIVHIPATHDHIYMISLPRDSEVAIPDFPEAGFKGWRTKINAAFAFGNLKNGKPDFSEDGRRRGVKLAAMTINNLVPGGLRFNGVAIINFMGFRQILEVLGGVHLCVDEQTRSIQFDKQGKYHTKIENVSQQKVYEVGCRDMAAWEALDFARQRYSVQGGDYGRQRHQQQLLMAIFTKLASQGTLTNPGKLLELQKAAGGLMTLDLGQTEIADWVFTLKSLRAQDITMIKTNGGVPSGGANGNEILTPATMELLKSVHDDTVFDFVVSHPTWIAAEK